MCPQEKHIRFALLEAPSKAQNMRKVQQELFRLVKVEAEVLLQKSVHSGRDSGAAIRGRPRPWGGIQREGMDLVPESLRSRHELPNVVESGVAGLEVVDVGNSHGDRGAKVSCPRPFETGSTEGSIAAP
jgi:hypothetical protein